MKRGYAGTDVSRVDFIGDCEKFRSAMPLMQENIESAIQSKLDVNVLFLTATEILERGDVEEYSENFKGLIRVIEIDSYDARVCMGTHVQNTAAIGNFKISEPELISSDSFKVNIFLD